MSDRKKSESNSQVKNGFDKDYSRHLLDFQKRARLDDVTIDQYEHQINIIFQIANILQRDTRKDLDALYYLLDHELPTPSIFSIISLSIQLKKLQLLDLKLRVDSIHRARGQLTTKVEKLTDKKLLFEQKLDQIRLKMLKKEASMIRIYQEELEKLNTKIEDYQLTKIKQVELQALKLQHANFKVICEVSFHQKDKKLLLNQQPILKVEEFLGYNLLVINQFLERLIVLQSQVAYLFNMELPYLNELVTFLPDEKFYNLIRKKEMIISGLDGNEEDDEQEDVKTPDIPNDIQNPTEKIFRMGDGYNLPPSSKTLNFQMRRRASSVEPADLNNIPVIKELSLPLSSPSKKPVSKKIIIPHKIINKPFNKLSIKDFLKFVNVIVKIIINFQLFLIKINNSQEPKILDWCNFQTILQEVMKVDQVLKDRIYTESTTNTEVTQIPKKIDTKENFESIMEHVYNTLMRSSYSRKQHSGPVALQDLNLKSLINNQPKLNFSNEWDIVSGML